MIDIKKIAQTLEFDVEDVEMLVDMFLDDATGSLDSVQTALESEDFQELKNIAHAIKGSALNLMLEDIADIALKIELLAKEESEADYKTMFQTLKEEIDILRVNS